MAWSPTDRPGVLPSALSLATLVVCHLIFTAGAERGGSSRLAKVGLHLAEGDGNTSGTLRQAPGEQVISLAVVPNATPGQRGRAGTRLYPTVGTALEDAYVREVIRCNDFANASGLQVAFGMTRAGDRRLWGSWAKCGESELDVVFVRSMYCGQPARCYMRGADFFKPQQMQKWTIGCRGESGVLDDMLFWSLTKPNDLDKATWKRHALSPKGADATMPKIRKFNVGAPRSGRGELLPGDVVYSVGRGNFGRIRGLPPGSATAIVDWEAYDPLVGGGSSTEDNISTLCPLGAPLQGQAPLYLVNVTAGEFVEPKPWKVPSGLDVKLTGQQGARIIFNTSAASWPEAKAKACAKDIEDCESKLPTVIVEGRAAFRGLEFGGFVDVNMSGSASVVFSNSTFLRQVNMLGEDNAYLSIEGGHFWSEASFKMTDMATLLVKDTEHLNRFFDNSNDALTIKAEDLDGPLPRVTGIVLRASGHSTVRLDNVRVTDDGFRITLKEHATLATSELLSIRSPGDGFLLEASTEGHVAISGARAVNSTTNGFRIHVDQIGNTVLRSLKSSQAGQHGIYVDVRRGWRRRWWYPRPTNITIDGAEVDAAGNDGLYVRLFGSTILTVLDVRATNNGRDGVELLTLGRGVDVDVRLAGGVLQDNGGAGAALRGPGSTSAKVVLSDVDTRGNIGSGLDLESFKDVQVRNVTAHHNGGYGVILHAAESGEAQMVQSSRNFCGLRLSKVSVVKLGKQVELWDNAIGLSMVGVDRQDGEVEPIYVVENVVGVEVNRSAPVKLAGIVHLNRFSDTASGMEYQRTWSQEILGFSNVNITVAVLMPLGVAAVLVATIPILIRLKRKSAVWAVVGLAALCAAVAIVVLILYNIALWNTDVWADACSVLNLLAATVLAITLPSFIFLRMALKQIVYATRAQVQERMDKAEVRRLMEASEFCKQRESVDDVNMAFREQMDEAYAERKDENKGYGAEQIAEQDRIINKTIRGTTQRQGAWGLFLAGGPGSGKGTVLRHLTRTGVLPPGAAMVDMDELRMQLKAYQAEEDKVLACRQTQAQAGYMAEVASHWCATERTCFVYDACLSGEAWHRYYFKFLRSKGVRLAILFVDTNVEVCCRRVLKREAQTGRPVPEALVRSKNEDCRNNQERLCEAVNIRVIVKNDDEPTFAPGDQEKLRKFLWGDGSEDKADQQPSAATPAAAGDAADREAGVGGAAAEGAGQPAAGSKSGVPPAPGVTFQADAGGPT